MPFIMDAGYQYFGNIRRDDANSLDFRQLVEEENAIFLGKSSFIVQHNGLTGFVDPFIGGFL